MYIVKNDNTGIVELISDFEQNNKLVIPEQYREFLLKYNGGETPRTSFVIKNVSSDIRAFYNLGDSSKTYSFDVFEKVIEFDEYREEGFLPIAENIFGDYILLGIGKDNNGKIYFLYHDRIKKYIELSKDLKTFIEKCASSKLGHIKTVEERKESLQKKGKSQNVNQGIIEMWQKAIDKHTKMVQEEVILT